MVRIHTISIGSVLYHKRSAGNTSRLRRRPTLRHWSVRSNGSNGHTDGCERESRSDGRSFASLAGCEKRREGNQGRKESNQALLTIPVRSFLYKDIRHEISNLIGITKDAIPVTAWYAKAGYTGFAKSRYAARPHLNGKPLRGNLVWSACNFQFLLKKRRCLLLFRILYFDYVRSQNDYSDARRGRGRTRTSHNSLSIRKQLIFL